MAPRIDYSFHRMPETYEELWWMVRALWGVTIPVDKVCPHHDPPFKAFASAYFADYPLVVWKASRGFGGKSFLLATLALTEQVCLNTSVTLLGGSRQQSDRVHAIMSQLWNHSNAPSSLLVKDPLISRTRLKNGSESISIAASPRAIRGLHHPRLRLDEVDEMPWDIYQAALGQPISSGGVQSQVVASSTHHNPGGTMTQIIKSAEEHDVPVYEWCIGGDVIVATPYGDIPMRDILIGDVVYAHQGGEIISTNVTDHWVTGISDTLIIETDAGELVCTGDHRILTPSGWVRADRLRYGSLVCRLYDSAQDVRSKAVSVLQRQDGSGFTSSRLWEGVLRLWGAQTDAIQELLDLLPNESVEAEYSGPWEAGAGSPETRSESEAWNQIRRSVPRRFNQIGNSVHRTGADGKMGRRLYGRMERGGDRSIRQILAQQAGERREGCSQNALHHGSGLPSRDSVGRSSTSMVESVVRSIRSGPSIDVYDLTVADGSSFVAGGLVVHNCYRETSAESGWLDQGEIERSRQRVSARTFAVEFDLQLPSDESRAIVPYAVEMMFDKALGVYEGKLDELIILEDREPGVEYCTGADWARTLDFTVIVTYRVDANPAYGMPGSAENEPDTIWTLVAWERTGRRPWPEMIGRLNERMEMYGGVCAHDGEGIGDVIDAFITSRGDYVVAVRLRGVERQVAFDEYILAIEERRFDCPFIQYAYDEHLDVKTKDLSGRGHPPDTFIASALAYYARNIDDDF